MKYDAVIEGKSDKPNIRLNLFERNIEIRNMATVLMFDLLVMNTTDAPKQQLANAYDDIIKIADNMLAKIKQCKLVLRMEEEE